MRCAVAGIVLAGLLSVVTARAAEPVETNPCRAWPYFQELPLPQTPAAGKAATAKWYDFVVSPSVFDQAREDLGDLRLYDAAGTEIPYALRIRRPMDSQQEVAAREFNRTVGADQSSELTLDLGVEPPEHNEVEVHTPGINYRRAVNLEGSADGQLWRKLLAKNLVDFKADDHELSDLRLVYPPSRYRYLRLRVDRDPLVDTKPVEISQVVVRRKIEVPGEFATLPAGLGPREAVRAGSEPGSAWILDLGAAKMPCEKVLVDIADPEFARDYGVEAAGVAGSDEPFRWIAGGQWSRRAGDGHKPLEAKFDEARAGRLKLTVTDFRNPPLDLRGAKFVATVRQVVLEAKASLRGPLRVYYGNPAAEPPHYDLERNLPALLSPPPERLTAGPRQDNPAYVAEPKPFSERWPWAIYVVLGGASLGLAMILSRLARTAVALHDAAQTQTAA